ncbi:hypothetical protein ACFLR3_03255 [Campylobacterota bacterium]
MSNINEKKNDSLAKWDNQRSFSSLETSESDLSHLRKDMIRFALNYPIHDIRTYSGYKGDLLVEITASNLELLYFLQSHAESIGMQTVVKVKRDLCIHELYCITPDDQIYKLKEPE